MHLEPHPLLDAVVFDTTFDVAIGEVDGARFAPLLRSDAPAPLGSDEAVRAAIRELLRFGGYKPTGRGKPASEYLLRAASEGTLGTINAAVDACNVASLHSGLPISVIDLDKARAPLRIAIAPAESSYVFNASGQVIDVSGLLCLFDAEGPCANGVKDAQRTKTSSATRRTRSVLWGSNQLVGRSEATFRWYRDLLVSVGARVERLQP